ncbi:MAG: nitroreductase/quinone reductase family protein, partial [Candidatus Roseilinea sp.]|uniref:nitroreductase/quinone reductase family protein n=1 Tax=Candidatus Roseilinea sp. TaxID=2838777 RepID=UPI00404ADD79
MSEAEMEPAAFDWAKMKNIQKIHRFLYAAGLGPIVGKIILLLTTTGRKSGQKRVTPLQYEEIDGKIYLGSARGTKSDWYRNVEADSRVEVRVKKRRFRGTAETVTDSVRIADFLEIRLRRHPRMVGLLMEKAHGLPRRPSREQLETLAASETMI